MLLVNLSLYVGLQVRTDFPGISVVKNPSANAGDSGSIPVSRRSPERENSKPLQYSCRENPMDKGTWRVAVHGVAEGRTRLNDWALCKDTPYFSFSLILHMRILRAFFPYFDLWPLTQWDCKDKSYIFLQDLWREKHFMALFMIPPSIFQFL